MRATLLGKERGREYTNSGRCSGGGGKIGGVFVFRTAS